MNRVNWSFWLCVLILVSPFSATRVEGRGICNVFESGTKELQGVVASAGSQFFTAGSNLWLMFADVEAGKMDVAQGKVKTIADGFRKAADDYKKAANLVDSATKKALAEVDIDQAVRLAGVTPGAFMFQKMDLRKPIKEQKGEQLLVICSELSSSLGKKTETASGKLGESAVLWDLMREWNVATFHGRFISSVFSLTKKP